MDSRGGTEQDCRLQVGLGGQRLVDLGGIIFGQLFLEAAYTLPGLSKAVLKYSNPGSRTFTSSRKEAVATDWFNVSEFGKVWK